MELTTSVVVVITVHTVGGCGHLCLQPGERDELPDRVQLLRQDVSLQERSGNPTHPGRNARYGEEKITLSVMYGNSSGFL